MCNCGSRWQYSISSSSAVVEELTLEEHGDFSWPLIKK